MKMPKFKAEKETVDFPKASSAKMMGKKLKPKKKVRK